MNGNRKLTISVRLWTLDNYKFVINNKGKLYFTDIYCSS